MLFQLQERLFIMEDLFQVGAVTNSHGLRGEAKVFPTTDDPSRYKDLKEVIADTGKQRLVLEIDGVRFFKQMVIVKFKGIDDINEVLKYKGAKLYVTRENAVQLREDEYFLADLVGLHAETEEGKALGSVKNVLQTGANDVYVIQKDDGRELLVPAIKECVKKIDLEGGRIVLHLLPGLEA